MNLIIIEGKPEKGEFKFWSYIITNHATNTELLSLDWAQKLDRELGAVLKSKLYTNILVMMDTTALFNRVEDIRDLIADNKEAIKKANMEINLQLLSYYCFEDCILYFDNLLSWLYSKDIRDNKVIQVQGRFSVSDVLQHYKDLGRTADLNYTESRKWEKDALLCNYVLLRRETNEFRSVSKEKIAGWLLLDITGTTNFRVKKGYMSTCWVCDCRNKELCVLISRLKGVPRGNIQRKRDKIKCGLWDNNKNSITKLNELFHKSFVLNQLLSIPWLKFNFIRR